MPVLVLKSGPPKSYKYRVRWLDGDYAGLDEWVPRKNLLCPWDEVTEYIEEERKLAQALDASAKAYKSLLWEAIEFVFIYSGNCPFSLSIQSRHKGLLTIYDFPTDVRAAGLDPEELLSEPLAFVDRAGEYWAPFATAERYVTRIAVMAADKLLKEIERQEEAWRQAVVLQYYVSPYYPDDIQYAVSRAKAEERLRKLQPVFQMVRQWCGVEKVAAHDELKHVLGEMDRLVSLLTSVIGFLRSSGHQVKANMVERELRRLRPEIPETAKTGRRKRSV